MQSYDTELQRHNEVLRAAVNIQPHERVLDIGCGDGQTTREAAGTARSALGVDLRAAAIERARAGARAEDLHNVSFECADVAAHCFAPAGFDLAMSRFGTMFFADPASAFGNIGRAVRPGGRLVMMVWQAVSRNEWAVAIRRALGVSTGPAAFSLADPAAVKEILQPAGFTDIGFTDVHEPVYYGPDVAAALDWVRGFAGTNDVLTGPDSADALERLREALAAHLGNDGVWLDSRAWIVSARRS